MYGVKADGRDLATGSEVCAEMDIEAAIKQEVEELKNAKQEALFRPVRIDIACGKLTALWRACLHSDAASQSYSSKPDHPSNRYRWSRGSVGMLFIHQASRTIAGSGD